MSSNYQLLINKLNEFTRRYYKNELLKGAILSVGLLTFFFLIFVFLEYFGMFGIATRTIFYWSYIILALAVIIRWILYPIFKILRIGKIISHEDAAKIIGKHFSEVSDVLLNTLQLKNNPEDRASKELIEAGINQKIEQLKPIPFQLAISYKTALKYLKFGVPPLIILLIIMAFQPKIIQQPTERIINHRESYIPPAPFEFHLITKDLIAIQSEKFDVEVSISGDILPENVFINYGNNSFRMKKTDAQNFSYQFNNIQKATIFYLSGGGVESQKYRIEIIPKPQMLSFDVQLQYPSYTGLKSEIISNLTDILVPVGTVITWNLFTRDVDKLLIIHSKTDTLTPINGNQFSYKQRMMNDLRLKVVVANQHLSNKDTLVLSGKVIPDAFPAIAMEQRSDSIYDRRIYFRGIIEDDYGFTRLLFIVAKSDNGDETIIQRDTIDIINSSNRQDFFHFRNLSDFDLEPGDQISYYFEVWDNDAIHGAKSARSEVLYYKLPTKEAIENETAQSNENIRTSLDDAMLEVQKLQQEMEKLQRSLLDKPTLDWEDKKKVEDLLNRQQDLEKSLETIRKENEEKAKKEEQFKKIDDDLLQKQRELEELFNKLMTDEVRKLMEEMQKQMDNIQKDKLQEMLEKMKENNLDLKEQLDRDLNLFRQLEFEKDLRETIEALEKLAEDQKKLAEETQKADKKQLDSLKKEQDKINQEFEKLSEKMKELEKKDQALDTPNNFVNPEEQQEEIKKEQENASESMSKGQQSKAKKSQDKAAEEMQQMADKLSAFEMNMAQEGLEEDIESLREILENLLQISFNQESLIVDLQQTNLNNPKYLEIIRNQKQLKDDFRMVEDSLKSLAKRQFMIKQTIYGELKTINNQMGRIFKILDNRQKPQAGVSQQYILTAVNNLTLLLDESLQAMLNQQQSMCNNPSNSQCKKPGSCSKPGNGKKPSAKTMKQLQDQLAKQLEDLKNGKQQQGQSMSEQLVRAAAQQQAIREMMQQYMNELKEEGQPIDGDLRKAMDDMEKTETDIINRMITQETIRRQKDILTRLLKSEKAELEREKEEKRESTEAKEQQYSNPKEFFQSKDKDGQMKEQIRLAQPDLKPYYRNKTSDYLFKVE